MKKENDTALKNFSATQIKDNVSQKQHKYNSTAYLDNDNFTYDYYLRMECKRIVHVMLSDALSDRRI